MKHVLKCYKTYFIKTESHFDATQTHTHTPTLFSGAGKLFLVDPGMAKGGGFEK